MSHGHHSSSASSLSAAASAAKLPLALSMKGRIASRAHSFKENILEALGHHHPQQPQGAADIQTEKPHVAVGHTQDKSIHLAKKNNSTDNLIGYSEPRKSTEALVRDVQLSLKYFEDAVSKGTHELLPGCASIVLERLVGIQAFVCNDRTLKDDAEITDSLHNLFQAVSALTEWADSVIIEGSIACGENLQQDVIEPVRKAVQILVNKLNRIQPQQRDGKGRGSIRKKGNLHNSLPDISKADEIDQEEEKSDRCRDTRDKKSSTKRRRQAKSTSSNMDHEDASPTPPPLPPKQNKKNAPQHIDWFSNPLFDHTSHSQRNRSPPKKPYSKYETSFIDTRLSSPSIGLDTTLPDSSNFPFMDETDNACFCGDIPIRLEGALTSDIPPALPVKESKIRKRTQYDNVFVDPPLQSAMNSSTSSSSATARSNNLRQRLARQNHPPPLNLLPSSHSFDCSNGSELQGGATGPSIRFDNNNIGRISEFREVRDERRNSDGLHPPPLPPKKRDIINYMEMLGQSLLPTREELMKSLAQTQMLLQNVWAENYHQFGEFIPDNSAFNFPASQDLFTQNVDLSRLVPDFDSGLQSPSSTTNATRQQNSKEDNVSLLSSRSMPPPPPLPPALPPKKGRTSNSTQNNNNNNNTSRGPERIIPIVRESDGTIISPRDQNYSKRCSADSLLHSKRYSTESTGSISAASSNSVESSESGWPKKSSQDTAVVSNRRIPSPPLIPCDPSEEEELDDEGRDQDCMSMSTSMSSPTKQQGHTDSDLRLSSPLVPEDSALNKVKHSTESLVHANNAEGILELRAGDVDSLIVLATESTSRDYVYQDAFLLTYRTFVSTLNLLRMLEYRFRKFNCAGQADQLRVARSSFSLLVRVVDSLIDSDFQDSSVVSNLSNFISELVSDGELLLARALRSQFIHKYEEHRTRMLPDLDFARMSLSNKPPSILQFKSSELAEQITLLDAQLFFKLEPGELLLWVTEQNEEKSPNLVKFTKHFNAMSYWCRTRILQESDAKERERLVSKFIKVMKFLRKHNNFNSYLAFLSALDSASIRRLDWSKGTVETIREYSAIIDFSGSFKAYREALAQSRPPAIPYMGLVLQDLTFVHIGNNDKVKGKVNFAKRWQQYNILDNLRRFKRHNYSFQRRDDIIRCFDSFQDALTENELWELSEKLKPRQRTSPVKMEPTTPTSLTPSSAGYGAPNMTTT